MGQLHKIEEAITAIRNGEVIIVVDAEDRENEGDFILAAEDATPEAINFLITIGRGLVCAPVSTDVAQRLNLKLMTEDNSDSLSTAFTVSIDAKEGTTTGISSQDRSLTLKKMADISSVAEDFNRPGHIFPLIARNGGVKVRPGHTEASIDLMRLAGKKPVAVICEILASDGRAALFDELLEIANEFNLKMVSIEDLIKYLEKNDNMEGYHGQLH